MPSSNPLMGATAVALALGISRQMVYQYTIEGKITARDGKYDIEQVRAQLAANLGSKKGGVPRRGERTAAQVSDSPAPVSEPASPSAAPQNVEPPRKLGFAKADLEKLALGERIRRDKIRNDLDEGKLLKAEEVRIAVTGMIARARSKLLVIGDELAERLAVEAEPVRCRQLVDERIYQALAELAPYSGIQEHPVAA